MLIPFQKQQSLNAFASANAKPLYSEILIQKPLYNEVIVRHNEILTKFPLPKIFWKWSFVLILVKISSLKRNSISMGEKISIIDAVDHGDKSKREIAK